MEENDMCISMTSLVCDSSCKKANNCMGYTACNGCGMPSCPACDLDENGYCDRCSEDRFNCALCDENLPLTDSVEVSGVFYCEPCAESLRG